MTAILAPKDCPPQIVRAQIALRVPYIDFNGAKQIGIIEVNKEAENDVARFFKVAFAREFPIERVVRAGDKPYEFDDDKLMLANATSGFNYRDIPGSHKLSNHAYGLAFDVNTQLNPYIRYANGRQVVSPEGAVWIPEVPGTLYSDHPLVGLMKELGWEWGGDWPESSGRTDYQHFEKPSVQSHAA